MDERILGLLKEARRQLELERQRRSEPIAIVGIGCRLPGGASTPEEFWNLLLRGVDATGSVPADRWDAEQLYDADPDAPGKTYVRRGAFLDNVESFDSEFFGISPREALGMDPQQRLLLECAWEALEDAGIPPESLRGSQTGVWVGLCAEDYARRILHADDRNAIDAYSALGNTRSIAAGRISYVLDLRGPSVQLDTACSSSLVAVHQACQSLRSGECDVALAGGVNVMSAPESTIALSKLRALAPDGRCKTFDASADGYGRGEGCGVVVLKRLQDARAAGDRIYAVVRGSAINHDGRSNGLTAPNGLAQEAIVRTALANAGLDPNHVDYVEAHGTGTPLGDPIEVLALSRVYGEKRDASSPLYLGAVKSNLGHLEGAAGIAGLIKVALCLTYSQIAPHLHFKDPSPKIPWARLPVRVASSAIAWPRNGRARVAGVSSFGLSGTNAHTLLEEAPASDAVERPAAARPAEVVVLSARTSDALVSAARRLHEHLEQHPDLSLLDLAYSLATTRSALEQRLAIAATSRDELLSALAAFDGTESHVGTRGVARDQRGRLAWVFTGQGAQQLGMGRQLYDAWPVFRAALDRAFAAIDPHLDQPLRSVMWAAPGSSDAALLDQTGYTQPALFAFEWALAELWRSWGLEPHALAGHSVGEITAATVAGVFSLEDASRLVCARGRLMQALPAGGVMVSIAAPEPAVMAEIASYPDTISIAALNAPSSTVIAGVEQDVIAVADRFAARGVQTRRLTVSHAFHSPLMDPMLGDFARIVQSIGFAPARVPLVSNVSGALAGREIATPEYWVRHARQAVRFAQGVAALHSAGARVFLEIGPRPTLLGLVSASLEDSEVSLLGSLRPGRSEPSAILEALAGWFAHGGKVDWAGVFPPGSRRIALPRYSWQRQRYWTDAGLAQRLVGIATAHPLLGARIATAGADAVYESVLSSKDPHWLADHRVGGHVMVPGAAFAELIRAAAEEQLEGGEVAVQALVLQTPLIVPETGAVRMQVLVSARGSKVSVYSQPALAAPSTPWTLHATAELGLVAGTEARVLVDLRSLRERCGEHVDVAELYSSFAAAGLSYGHAFQPLRALRRGNAEAVAELELPDKTSVDGYAIHPTLLDGALQALAALLDVSGKQLLLPFEIGRFVVHRHGARSAIVRVSLSDVTVDGAVADLTIVDADGRPVAELHQLGLRRIDLALLGREAPAAPPAFFALDWREVAAPSRAAVTGRWLVLGNADDKAARGLVLALRGHGAESDLITLGQLAHVGRAEHVVCSWEPDHEPAGALHAAQRGLQAIQALLASKAAPRLYWLTRGATAVVDADVPVLSAAALWGLGRTLRAEHPELHLTLIDLDPAADAGDIFLREIAASDDEDQVAWRRGKRHVPRLVRAPRGISSSDNYELATQDKGVLDSLALAPIERRTPGPGEVEIEVVASGLNFRDVLNALGLYPGEAGPLGNECSGRIVGVGRGVAGFASGDRVMALAPGAFRRFVTVDARLVSAIPAAFSFEQAAGTPIVFLTAWYALHDLAMLQPGERILVHAAAGGVGMAAVQIARRIGARVLATASPSKWDSVRAMGVEQLASSRDLAFGDLFRKTVDGADVVLNALTGAFIDESLSLLPPGGRFIEMGKAEIRSADSLAARHPGVAYRAFDLGEVEPDRIAEMFRELTALFESGLLRPLPLRTFSLNNAEAAFRWMAQARHIGKIVLSSPASARRTDASVLVTGGLGALGLEVARHLASQGYRHLVLISRRGLDTYGAPDAVAALEALGARVTVAAVDATDRDAVDALLATLPPEYPLRGVVHAAGVIDDGLLEEQTAARFERVISPKVRGAWNLHELTRELDLDFFVLFSSMAGTLGSVAQGAYSAANAALDALAAHRHAHGLPGTSLAWGPWAERGMAAALDAKLQARFARQGISMLTPAQGRALFDAALSRGEAQLLVVPLDLRRAAKVFDGDVPPLWRALVRTTAASTPVEQAGWVRELLALPEEARLEAVGQMIRGELARVLSLASPELVPLDRPLQELGVDSLMAVEIRNALSRRTGVTLSATLAFDYPTARAIAGFILEQIRDPEIGLAPAIPAISTTIDEPIAIVGIGCHFPGGVTDPESFWQLLEQGIDAVTEVPRSRWNIDEWYDPDPDAPGKMTTRWGAFLDDIESFDAGFFGISPREAQSIDPQERLLLETTWQALEHAGIRPDSLMDSNTGVYMGLCGNEYQARVVADVKAINAYGMLGTMHSTMVGRLSYWLGLKGPNLPVDTACSSSLVAVHLAAQALRNGECRLALAGGANVVLGPEGMVYFSRLRAMSPTGRCHSFSADADGYVRAEGAGVVVLERLSDARRSGHRILALLRATAVNQDGRSNGLTAPNGPAQQAVIREALQRAGVAPADVGYVECHGTGTPLGDPIEVQALAAALSEGREPDQPVVLGSLKSNLGHMEGAAGIGGLIKAVLALQHNHIPKSLHFTKPNPHIDWDALPVKVAAEGIPWRTAGKARIAGVSSFGISGTNAHAVLEEAPRLSHPSAPHRSAELVVFSAKTPDALDAALERMRAWLETNPDVALGDVAFTLSACRALHDHRVALSVPSREALVSALTAAASRTNAAGVARARAAAEPGKLAWVFTGQGAQRLGMGRALYDEWPAFRDALDSAFAALDPHLDHPLRSVMWGTPGSVEAALLDQTAFTQPALFALEWALAQLWLSWGVQPQLVAGHSIGELSAAAVAGVFSLEDAARLVCARGRLMQALPTGGAMVSIAAPEAEVATAVAPHGSTVAIAAVNGPASIVISGSERDVAVITEQFAARGVHTTRLVVSHAFHSPLMEPMLHDFRRVAESVRFERPRIPLVSNLSGALATDDVSSPEYWVQHVRGTVLFARGSHALHVAGADTFIEMGPRPTLLGLVGAALPETARPNLLASMRPERSEPLAVLDALGTWVARGGDVNWRGVFPTRGRRLALPSYPWQRQRYWLDKPSTNAHSTDLESLSARLRQLAERGLLTADAVRQLPQVVAALAKGDEIDTRVATSAYQLEWQPRSLGAQRLAAAGSWALIGSDDDDSRQLTTALGSSGIVCRHLKSVDELPPAMLEGLHGVIQLLGADESSARSALKLAQIAVSFEGTPPKVWWVTRGAVGVSERDAPTNPAQATVWGLARTFALEHPQAWGGIVDASQTPLSAAEVALVPSIVLGDHQEDQVAVRGSSTFVPRLRRAALGAQAHGLSLRGTILITGGLGALGLHVAHWLAQQGAQHLLLVSRQGSTSPGAVEAVRQLEAAGAKVTLAAADVADRDAMAQVLRGVPEDAPLTAVFHAAGVDDRTPITEVSSERFDAVITPKRDGVLILDELTRDLNLDAFVCFSSMSGLFGSVRQAAYAAANAFLDAWAQSTRAAGRKAFSVAWGPWSDGGMADAQSLAYLARHGVTAITPELGKAALHGILAKGACNTVLTDVDWRVFSSAFEAWHRRRFLDEMEGRQTSPSDDAGQRTLLTELAGLSESDRKSRMQAWLVEQCAQVLGVDDPGALDLHKGFFDLGLDSLMVTTLRQRVEQALGFVISTTAVFSYPNIAALVAYLLQRIEPAHATSANATSTTEEQQLPLETEEDLIRFIDAKFEAEGHE